MSFHTSPCSLCSCSIEITYCFLKTELRNFICVLTSACTLLGQLLLICEDSTLMTPVQRERSWPLFLKWTTSITPFISFIVLKTIWWYNVIIKSILYILSMRWLWECLGIRITDKWLGLRYQRLDDRSSCPCKTVNSSYCWGHSCTHALEVSPNSRFRWELEDNQEVYCHLVLSQ